MSHATYVKEFLDAMYVKDFLEYSVETINGVTNHSHIYSDGQDQIELVSTVEYDGTTSFIVTGRHSAPDFGFDSEIELISTEDPDKAMARFEEAIEAVRERI